MGLANRLNALSRFSGWWHYKISYLLAPFYVGLLAAEVDLGRALAIGACLLVYFIATAVFGHIVNDLGDVAMDARAGKPNAWAGASPSRAILVLLVLVFVSFVSLWLAGAPLPLYALAVFEFLLFLSYSLPPLRLKESRMGLLVDSGYAHVVPFCVSALVLWPRVGEGDYGVSHGLLLSCALVWQLFCGLRGILVHEIEDHASDTAAGARTAVVRMGLVRTRKLMARVILPAEWGFLVITFAALWAVEGLWLPLLCLIGYLPIRKRRSISGTPLLDRFYRQLLPLAVLVAVLVVVPTFWPLLLLHLLLFPVWRWVEGRLCECRIPRVIAEHTIREATSDAEHLLELRVDGAYLTSRFVDRGDIQLDITVSVDDDRIPVAVNYGPNQFADLYTGQTGTEKPVCFRIDLPLPRSKPGVASCRLAINLEWDEDGRERTAKLHSGTIELPHVTQRRADTGQTPTTLLYFGPTNVVFADALRMCLREEGLTEKLEAADELIRSRLGWSLLDRIKGDPLAKGVSLFEDCLVSEGIYQLVTYERLKAAGLSGDLISSVSLGEVTAARAAGAMDFNVSVRICCFGALTLRAPKQSDMIVISAPDEKIQEIVSAEGWECYPAIVAEHTCVWAGMISEITKLETRLATEGIENGRLYMDCAPHTPLIQTSQQKADLQDCDFQPITKGYFSTITGGRVTGAVNPDLWCRWIANPSILTSTLDALSHENFDQVICIGSAQFDKDLRKKLAQSHPHARVIKAEKWLETHSG